MDVVNGVTVLRWIIVEQQETTIKEKTVLR